MAVRFTPGLASDHLAKQDLSTLDLATLHPNTPEVISRQATINIGTIGHVAHGKSTLVKAISGVHTVRFKNEMERNITIKLGYANAKIYRCMTPGRERPGHYQARGSKHVDRFTENDEEWELVRHVSFVDCPGHDILMATMLNGAAVMDAALLLVAGNEPCPQPQTSEHLAAVEIMRLGHIIILQNKIDLVKEDQAKMQHQQIRDFVAGTVADGAPILPISAQLGFNIDVVCEYIVNRVPVPLRDFTSTPRMIVIRSFDVNKPGEDVENLKGGVAGGSILQGVLKLGDKIEVRPGIVSKDRTGHVRCSPIFATIVSLCAEKNDLKFAVPGGLIGVGTKIDPTLTRSDRLVGQVLGLKGHLPQVFLEIEISYVRALAWSLFLLSFRFTLFCLHIFVLFRLFCVYLSSRVLRPRRARSAGCERLRQACLDAARGRGALARRRRSPPPPLRLHPPFPPARRSAPAGTTCCAGCSA